MVVTGGGGGDVCTWWRRGLDSLVPLFHIPHYLAYGSRSISLQIPPLTDRGKEKVGQEKGDEEKPLFFPAAFITTLHHPLLTVFPLLLKSASWTQSYGCPTSLSILGVPIVYFVLSREISVCLLAFLNVGSTQPQLWDTDLPQPYPPSRHGAGGRFCALGSD